ncbi:hypothetical protein ACRAR1_16590 [Streptomyces sanyensis]
MITEYRQKPRERWTPGGQTRACEPARAALVARTGVHRAER